MFQKYCDKIKALESFEKEDILNKNFELYNQGNMKIYYAPHNEIINNNARIFIVGITPGWTQTSIAYKTAHDGLMNNLDYETIKKECKRNSRFAGSMRKNLIEMLDELKLNEKLNINSSVPYTVYTTFDYSLNKIINDVMNKYLPSDEELEKLL